LRRKDDEGLKMSNLKTGFPTQRAFFPASGVSRLGRRPAGCNPQMVCQASSTRGDDQQPDGMFSYISPNKKVPQDHRHEGLALSHFPPKRLAGIEQELKQPPNIPVQIVHVSISRG
jgi:hypothetical protein